MLSESTTRPSIAIKPSQVTIMPCQASTQPSNIKYECPVEDCPYLTGGARTMRFGHEEQQLVDHLNKKTRPEEHAC